MNKGAWEVSVGDFGIKDQSTPKDEKSPTRKGTWVFIREREREKKSPDNKKQNKKKIVSSKNSRRRHFVVAQLSSHHTTKSHGTVRLKTDRWSLEVRKIEERGGSRRAVGQTDARQRREFKGAGKRVVLSGAF